MSTSRPASATQSAGRTPGTAVGWKTWTAHSLPSSSARRPARDRGGVDGGASRLDVIGEALPVQALEDLCLHGLERVEGRLPLLHLRQDLRRQDGAPLHGQASKSEEVLDVRELDG